MDVWDVYFALKSIKRHASDLNYGLMTTELDALGEKLEEELKPVDDLRRPA